MKKELNKWYIGLDFGKRVPWSRGLHPFITFYLLKLKSYPEAGEELQKKHYIGIYINKVFSPVIVIRTYTLFKGKFRINIPTRLW